MPFTLKIKLISNQSFTLHGPFGICDEHTKIIIKDHSGNPTQILSNFCGGVVASTNPLDSDTRRSYDGAALTEDEIYLPAGNYRISAEYHSIGPYLDRYSNDDIRPVEGIWIGELQSNEVHVKVKNPEGIDQNVILNLGLSPQDASSPERLSWFLKERGTQILEDYPKSTYAGWIQWTIGNATFNHYGGNETSVKEDIDYPNFIREIDKIEPIVGARDYREKMQRVIDEWEPLYRDFPNFSKRSFVMLGLAQVYIRQGEYQKAKQMIDVLLKEDSKSPENNKALAYKEALQAKGLWK
jgi:hypothetical protein